VNAPLYDPFKKRPLYDGLYAPLYAPLYDPFKKKECSAGVHTHIDRCKLAL